MLNFSMTVIPGENDIHRFDIPYDSSLVEKAIVSYVQTEEVVFEKTIDSFESGGTNLTYITVNLTQEDSLMLKDNVRLEIQINILLHNGTRMTSKPISVPVGKQYHREVIT